MVDENSKTLQTILTAAKNEFMEKGYQLASLRNIVKTAGVTTGAIYGYYKSKDELFSALVDEPATALMNKFSNAQQDFEDLPLSQKFNSMSEISSKCMDWMVEHIYDNYDAFKLILCKSEGTEYQHFIHNMVVIEVDATEKFIKLLNESGHNIPDIDSQLMHILCSGLFSGFFEIVIHDMPKQQSLQYVKQLKEFYTAGWRKIMEL